MKNVYLENTNNHHNKFYHMIENKDGASFTASWGRIGMNGISQVYGINEWSMKYQEKINKGYKDTTNVTPPSNWIQGMSVAQRKKQGITTVKPPKKAIKKAIKKTAKKIHYDVGQVDIVVDHSHMNKLRILHMTLHNWEKNNGQVPMDSRKGRMFETDLHKVEELTERGTETMLESDTEFLGTSEFLTKEEMLDMNVLFKTYGGKRVTQ
jgi:predicted DNA-binding WGR domain protein